MVLYLQAGVSPCGGALVASKYVVTAAHCLFLDDAGTRPKNASDINITLGEHDRSIKDEGVLPEKTIGVAKIYTHEDYRGIRKVFMNDIAVLELSEDVDLETYTPVCLPKTSDNFYGTVSEAYGWGHTKFNGKLSDKLLKVMLPVVNSSNSNCQKSMDADRKPGTGYHDGKICAGGRKGKDACQVAGEDII